MGNFFTQLKEMRLVKGLVYLIVGAITYPGLNIFNKLQIKGMENLHKLPKKNVLFVSNHQTYFLDVITFIHIFCAVSWRAFLLIVAIYKSFLCGGRRDDEEQLD